MPALGMAQETGKIIRWLKAEGDDVQAGESIMEIETDKVTVEIEAPAAGRLAGVSAAEGDDVPVGQAVAVILGAGESLPERPEAAASPVRSGPKPGSPKEPLASPVAARIAAEHNLDLRSIKPDGGRVHKADVVSYLHAGGDGPQPAATRVPASPKARRLAANRGLDLAALDGSGPEGAVLAVDVLTLAPAESPAAEPGLTLSSAWQVMAERVTRSWSETPHFYLLREAHAQRLIDWRASYGSRTGEKITYTDLLVRLVAAALREHPQVNASWQDGIVRPNKSIHVGLAVATESELIVPVIHNADELSLEAIAARRGELVLKANENRLEIGDVQGGTFTISNLGMYGVDSFTAIINPPQAAILAVGRIAERIVPVDGRPEVRPTIMLSLSCDHRVVDGARGAQFLQTLVEWIEEPLGLLK